MKALAIAALALLAACTHPHYPETKTNPLGWMAAHTGGDFHPSQHPAWYRAQYYQTHYGRGYR